MPMFLADFSVTEALTTGTELINWVFDLIAANPILTAVFVVGTLLPIGIGVFGHLKNTVR